MTEQSFANHFLLSMPKQHGGYFEGSLTYLCMHGADGAYGLVVNRPLDLKLNRLLADGNLKPILDDDVYVLEGGPVEHQQPAILHFGEFQTEGTVKLHDGLKLTIPPNNVYEILEAIAENAGPDKYLFALGYAGWKSGQLEQEINQNAWLTCPAKHSILFDDPFGSRILHAAQTIGIDLDLMTSTGGEA